MLLTDLLHGNTQMGSKLSQPLSPGILRRIDDWKDGRRSRHTDDMDVLLRIHHVIGELILPT